MVKFYQTEWFGIKFSEITKLSYDKIAGEDFYNKFYEELFKKYKSYEQLPVEWRTGKDSVVNFFKSRIQPKEKIVSIGCGLGYIEYQLSNAGYSLIAFEPSKIAATLIKETSVSLVSDYFTDKYIEVANDSDVFVSTAVDYVFNKKELINFLILLINSGAKKFILVSASCKRKAAKKFLDEIKNALLNYKYLWSEEVKKAQLWGFIRTESEFIKAFKIAGFSIQNYGWIDDTNFYIEGNKS